MEGDPNPMNYGSAFATTDHVAQWKSIAPFHHPNLRYLQLDCHIEDVAFIAVLLRWLTVKHASGPLRTIRAALKD
jgi:hypothetical protein